jgi:hypothetical protein
MPGFEDAWSAVSSSKKHGKVSPELKALLQTVYLSVLATPPNLSDLKGALEGLLNYLAVEGRTNANCWATDLFFMASAGWERDWSEQELPEDFRNVLGVMSGALHDTVQAPEVAANFDSMPEQILEHVRNLRT